MTTLGYQVSCSAVRAFSGRGYDYLATLKVFSPSKNPCPGSSEPVTRISVLPRSSWESTSIVSPRMLMGMPTGTKLDSHSCLVNGSDSNHHRSPMVRTSPARHTDTRRVRTRRPQQPPRGGLKPTTTVNQSLGSPVQLTK